MCRIAFSVGYALYGAALCAVVFPMLGTAARMRHVRRWSRGMLRVLGIGLDTTGQVVSGPVLLVANHVSWLDILVINAIEPARFVSKADVRAWPVLGFMVAQGGTLFIERERRRDALRVVHGVAEALRRGERVAVFPEGTTGTGPEVLPFHANLLQAAIATAQPTQPVALRYADRGSRFSPHVEYIGETTLVQSLWRVAAAPGLRAHVVYLPPRATPGKDRRGLAEAIRADVQGALDQSR